MMSSKPRSKISVREDRRRRRRRSRRLHERYDEPAQPQLDRRRAGTHPRATGLDLAALNQYSDYWETVRAYYLPFDNAPLSGTADVYLHEMPGGQYTNLREQAESMGLGEKWAEIARTYADVNAAFGDIVKVTPSSKVVGDMAIFLVTHGLTMADFEAKGQKHGLTLPNSVVDMFMGSLGQPDGGWPSVLQKRRAARPEADRGPAGASLAPVDLAAHARDLERLIAGSRRQTKSSAT